jgi:hypothetical protein
MPAGLISSGWWVPVNPSKIRPFPFCHPWFWGSWDIWNTQVKKPPLNSTNRSTAPWQTCISNDLQHRLLSKPWADDKSRAEDSRLDRGLVIQTFMGWKGKLQQKTDCQWRIMSHSSNLEKPHLQAEVAPRGVGLKDVGTSKLAIAPWSNKRVPSLRLQKTTPPANKGVQQHVVRKVLANTMYFPAGTLMVTDIYRYK